MHHVESDSEKTEFSCHVRDGGNGSSNTRCCCTKSKYKVELLRISSANFECKKNKPTEDKTT